MKLLFRLVLARLVTSQCPPGLEYAEVAQYKQFSDERGISSVWGSDSALIASSVNFDRVGFAILSPAGALYWTDVGPSSPIPPPQGRVLFGKGVATSGGGRATCTTSPVFTDWFIIENKCR